MPYATVEDLELRWRTLDDAEKRRAGILLEDAAVRIDAACPPPNPLLDAGRRARVVVSCDMVKRAMQTGADPGVEQTSQTAGPFGIQLKYANPAGDLYLTRADLRLLGALHQRAGNVSLLGRVP